MGNIAIYYLKLLPDIQDAARSCGYAVAMHGSMDRDFDLIAAPWTDTVKSPTELVETITRVVGGHIADLPDNEKWPRLKPHGRKCWCIQLGGGAYIDLSVMPIMSEASS